MTTVVFLLCSISLFINFKNLWFNAVKLLLSLAVTINGIQGIIHYESNAIAIISRDFLSRGELTMDERGMMEICSETAVTLGKVVYHVPTILCAVLIYIMLKVLIRRSVMHMPHSSTVTVNLTIIVVLILPFYCGIAYGAGMDNSIYNMMPLVLQLSLYTAQTMILPLMAFTVLCYVSEQYFSENTLTKYKTS